MAQGGVSNTFFKVGEIRPATDADFDYFKFLISDYNGWKKRLEKSGIAIFTKDMGKGTVKMVKVITEFKDVLPATLYDVIHDGQYRPLWDENLIADADVCALDDYNDIGYYSLKFPAPLKNRDFVNQRSWRVTENEYIVFNHSVAHEKYPPKKNFIRGLSYVTGFLLRSNGCGGCLVSYISHSDVRGQIPKWTINMGISKLVPKLLQKLEETSLGYLQWKESNNPNFKPWLFPEQNTLPRIDPALLTQNATAVLLGPAGEEEEEQDENVEDRPDGEAED